MKGILLASLVLLTSYVQATIRTVSNHPSTLAQFNTINAAIGASNTEDTIYVHGSPNSYAGFTIANKRLTILGPGFNPNIQGPLSVNISGACTISGVASKKSEFQGLIFNLTFTVNSPVPDSLRFYRNFFISNLELPSAASTYKGYILQGNFFGQTIVGNATSTYQDMLIQNNIFKGPNTSLSTLTSCINVLFDHNLWFNNSPSTTNIVFNVSLITLTNNIFVHRDFGGGGSPLAQSTFINNITFNCVTNSPWTFGSNIDGGGNISNMDPQMTDQTNVNSGAANQLSNFTIAAGPANNTGTDTKDLGLLYDTIGNLNWTNSRNSRMPQVTLMNITNPVIGAGGMLNVNVEARKNE